MATPSNVTGGDTPSNGPDRCTATTRAGRRCRRWPVAGLTVCETHGGGSPQSKAKSERIKAERGAYASLARFGTHVTVSPLDALLQELHRSAGVVAWFEAQLAATPIQLSGLTALAVEFAPDAAGGLGNGPALTIREEHHTIDDDGDVTTKIRIVENPLLATFRREREHLMKVAATCVKLGLEQRAVDAHVEAVRLSMAPVVELLREVVDDPALDGHGDLVRAVIGRHIAARRELVPVS